MGTEVLCYSRSMRGKSFILWGWEKGNSVPFRSVVISNSEYIFFPENNLTKLKFYSLGNDYFCRKEWHQILA